MNRSLNIYIHFRDTLFVLLFLKLKINKKITNENSNRIDIRLSSMTILDLYYIDIRQCMLRDFVSMELNFKKSQLKKFYFLYQMIFFKELYHISVLYNHSNYHLYNHKISKLLQQDNYMCLMFLGRLVQQFHYIHSKRCIQLNMISYLLKE